MDRGKNPSGDRQRSLFGEEFPIPEPRWVEVNAAGVRAENPRQFGGPWLALELVRRLGLDEFLERVMPRGKERIPWSLTSLILVIARLLEPSSELFTAEQWYPKTALPELLGVPAANVDDNRLYRALDELLPHKRELERHLKQRMGELFALDYDLLLYDVTSTFFEGAAHFSMAQRGDSRDQRGDCKQVCIGLVVSRCGMPLGYKVFPGNTADVSTVQGIVTEKEARYGKTDRVWVMDRGMVSEKNLAFFREGGRKYLVGTPKALLKKYERELHFIMFRSRDRVKKEDRVLAHILVCFLSYVLWKTLGQICQKAGRGNELRRVLAEFSEVQLIDVILPTREGHELTGRCVSGASAHLTILLDHLGLRLRARVWEGGVKK